MKTSTLNLARGAMLAVAAFAITACGTTGTAPAPRSGTTYAVVKYEGLSNVPGSKPAVYSATEVAQLDQLDQSCRRQLDGQLPSQAVALAEGAADVGVPGTIGTMVGMLVDGVTDPGKVAGQVVGGYLGSGVATGRVQYKSAEKFAQAYCTNGMVYEAQRADGALQGIIVVPWMAGGSTKGLPAPTDGQATDPSTLKPQTGERPRSLAPPPGN